MVYVLARAFGKYVGVYAGALATGASRSVRDNLGLCMLPQAGVAIGLVLFLETSPVFIHLAETQGAAISVITNVVLFAVFVNELAGPPLSKLGLIRGAFNDS